MIDQPQRVIAELFAELSALYQPRPVRPHLGREHAEVCLLRHHQLRLYRLPLFRMSGGARSNAGDVAEDRRHRYLFRSAMIATLEMRRIPRFGISTALFAAV